MMGMPRRVLSAWLWNWLTMSTHAAGVFGVGVDPPPDSTDPNPNVAIIVGMPDGAALGLRHLTDLLLDGHAREQVLDAAADRRTRVEVRRVVHSGGQILGRAGDVREQ